MAKPAGGLSLERQLALRLFRNEHVRTEPGDAAGTLRVTVTLKYRSPRLAWLFKPRKERTYVLEGMGLDLYNACDGETTFGELVERWRREQRLTFFEARGVLVNFLHVLIERGLVVMAASGAPGEAEG